MTVVARAAAVTAITEVQQDRQCTACINVTLKRVRATVVAVEKQQVWHIVSVYACVNLGIQHAMRMRRIVICGLPGSTIFSTLSHKRHGF